MQADISILEKEIRFSTARSGGAGGQNVNKVETAVTGYWIPSESALISGEQLPHLLRHIAHRLNKEGVLQVKSQVHRSQYANRLEVIEKIATIIEQALQPRKPRIATKMPGAIKEKRLANKKRRAEIKQGRRRQSFME